MKFIQFIIYAVIGTVPLVFAAVQPWVWSVYVASVSAVFIAQLWTHPTSLCFPKSKIFLAIIPLFFSYILFQCLPLPPQIVSFLSPFRYQVLEKSWILTDSPASWQAISYSFLDSLSWWIFLLSLLMFFMILRSYLPFRRNMKSLILIMLITGTLEALYGLIQALVPSVGVLWVDSGCPDCARGTFICRNHFAGFIEMLWPLGLGYAMAYGEWQKGTPSYKDSQKRFLKSMVSSDRLYQQFFISIIVGILVLALVFSKSRAGITGAVIGLASFTLLVRCSNKKLTAGFWIIIVVVMGFFFFHGLKMGFYPIIERFLELPEGISRLELWRDGISIFKDHPLGIGVGNLKIISPVYYTSGLSERLIFSHAHNDYLQLLIETGWPGFLLMVSGFFIFLGISLGKLVKLNPYDDSLRFFIATGALSGLVSMTFHSFFDFNLQIPSNCFYFVLLISLIYACLWQRPDGNNIKGDYKSIERS